ADEFELCPDVAPDAVSRVAQLFDRRPALGFRVEIVGKYLGIELSEQRRVGRREVRDLALALARLPQEIDEQRHANAVAVLDIGGVDHERRARDIGRGAPGGVPQLGQRRRVEAARQRQRAPAMWGVADRQRRHVSGPGTCSHTRPENDARHFVRQVAARTRIASKRYSMSSSAVPATRTRSPSRTNGSYATGNERLRPVLSFIL